MKPGPIALVEAAVLIVVVATKGPLDDKVLRNLQEARAREGNAIAIATEGDTRIGQLTPHVLFVPDVDPVLAPLVTTIPLQLLAYHVADSRGTDVDQPRNLARSVTVEQSLAGGLRDRSSRRPPATSYIETRGFAELATSLFPVAHVNLILWVQALSRRPVQAY